MNATQRALESANLALRRAADAAVNGYGTTTERLQQITAAVRLYDAEDCWAHRLAALNHYHGVLAADRRTVEQIRTVLNGSGGEADKLCRVGDLTRHVVPAHRPVTAA